VDVVDDKDGFATARGAGGGVVDVEGACDVEGVIEKRPIVGAHEVEGVIDV
jgi:hypothetical protein